MNEHSGTTLSVWMKTAQPAPEPPLAQDAEAEVCVVGAGISGITTAYLLAREGRNVLVLDDGPVGSGETERTTAHLSNALDDRYTTLEKLHGEDGARLAAQSHAAAIEKIGQIAKQGNIPCDFYRLDGYLFTPPGGSLADLDKELKAAHRAGLVEVEKVARAPLASFDTGPCLRFPQQAQFNPTPYLVALAERIKERGGRIFSGARVTSVEEEDDRVTIHTASGQKVFCRNAVVATNTPINDRFTIHTKQAPYRTYVIAARIPQNSVPWNLYWDNGQTAEDEQGGTSGSYHYVRLFREPGDKVHDLLIVGGEDHKTGQAANANERWGNLERWAWERFPMIDSLAYQWSGQVLEPVDGLAFIGRNPGNTNVYIITGDSGHGITHGTLGAMLVTDLICGRPNEWAELYNPARTTLRSSAEFLKENLNVAATYIDYLARGRFKSEDEIPPGFGAVLATGLKKQAVYRSKDGSLVRLSAVCPHLKCIVHWNPGEQTWDCPCHGSRFTALGEVITGPATAALESINEKSW